MPGNTDFKSYVYTLLLRLLSLLFNDHETVPLAIRVQFHEDADSVKTFINEVFPNVITQLFCVSSIVVHVPKHTERVPYVCRRPHGIDYCECEDFTEMETHTIPAHKRLHDSNDWLVFVVTKEHCYNKATEGMRALYATPLKFLMWLSNNADTALENPRVLCLQNDRSVTLEVGDTKLVSMSPTTKRDKQTYMKFAEIRSSLVVEPTERKTNGARMQFAEEVKAVLEALYEPWTPVTKVKEDGKRVETGFKCHRLPNEQLIQIFRFLFSPSDREKMFWFFLTFTDNRLRNLFS